MTDVCVVGAGPVGLFLALRLHALGVTPRVLERRAGSHDGTRSIGVHPPSLERLEALGCASALVDRGVRVRAGAAYLGRAHLGTLDFGLCPAPHDYVLSVPQRDTEAVLRRALRERAPGALQTDAEVLDLTLRDDHAVVTVRRRGEVQREAASFVVACDGRWSRCRAAAGIELSGGAYEGAYLMCDAVDDTELGPQAAVFLHPRGLVESFPLPGGLRRWVVRREQRGDPSLCELATAVQRRTGHRIGRDGVVRYSGFVAERFVARRMIRGRLALAGDAAHVVSPIGGQGMNLGWLGAWSLAEALRDAVRAGRPTAALRRDGRRRRRLAQAAARRAELNMWLGRPGARLGRAALVRALLRWPLSAALARVFTMRGLSWGL